MDQQYILSHWETVRASLIDTIDKFRDEELEFRPFAISWSVRQMLLHLAHEENGEFNYGIVQNLAEFPTEYPIENYPTRASIESLLASVHSHTIEYLRALQPGDLDRVIHTPWGADYRLIEMFGHLIEHEIHHRAELSLILGMLGKKGLDA
jgi:uncharacterized damage-inducible protein DinB